MVYHQDQCGECKYINLGDCKEGRFYCSVRRDYVYANATACNSLSKASLYRYQDAEVIAAKEESGKFNQVQDTYTSSSCYITTIVVEILGKPDDCPELQTLRWFRNEILAPNEENEELLMAYDIYGGLLARSISTLENAKAFAEELYKIFISGCVKLINKGEYELAKVLYVEMVNALIGKFVARRPEIGEVARENYDRMAGGHGAFQMKPKKDSDR